MTTFNTKKDNPESLDNRNSSSSESSIGKVVSDTGSYRNSCNKKKCQVKKPCLVCGDLTLSYHYSVLSCEGCKAFFRRIIVKKEVYRCKYGNTCDIDTYMRRKCQQCRWQKCLRVGMHAQVSPTVSVVVKLGKKVNPISAEKEDLINRIIHLQNEFDHPSHEDMKKISTPGFNESEAEATFKYVTEMTILTVKLTVDFSKRLAGFDSLLRADQITLLKACSSEVMMLRCARRYDVNTDSIVFANNLPYTRESYQIAGLDEMADSVFGFCKTLSLMNMDDAEYALLTAITIFSERPGLVESKKLEKIQEIYLEALQDYVTTREKNQPIKKIAKLLAVLTELRTLGNLNLAMCSSLKLKNKRLPRFLVELWDI